MGFDDSVESRLHLHRMRFRREVFQDGRPTVLTEPLAQAGISHQRCDRCGQLLRAARFMEESVLAVLDILGRAAVASSDDRLSHSHPFSDNRPKGLRPNRSMHNNIQIREYARHIVAKPRKNNLVCNAEFSRLLSERFESSARHIGIIANNDSDAVRRL